MAIHILPNASSPPRHPFADIAHSDDGVCAVRGCAAAATVGHHVDYRAPEDWAVLAMCADHHQRLHVMFEWARNEGVSLAVLTLRYVLDPIAVERGAPRFARPIPVRVDARQLTFGDLHGPNGDYWRHVLEQDS